MSNMFFATPDLCWSAENPSGLSEHFWWISQQLQGLAIYMGQVRVSEFLHPICFRWSVDCVFSACSYEQGDWKFNSIILLAELLLVAVIHPDHPAVTRSSFWVTVDPGVMTLFPIFISPFCHDMAIMCWACKISCFNAVVMWIQVSWPCSHFYFAFPWCMWLSSVWILWQFLISMQYSCLSFCADGGFAGWK